MHTLMSWKHVVPVLVLGTITAGRAHAQCAFTPTNDVTNDAELGEPLLYGGYGGNLGIFNVYWDDNWDADPNNFRKADIENAIQEVIGTPYFDRLCQYGVNGFHFEGGTESVGACGKDPGPTTSTTAAFSFMSCEEYTPFDGVPLALGAPNPLTCAACGLLPIDCFTVLDPIGTATCLATPNPTGSRIYVLLLPKGTTIDDFGRKSCIDYGAFHFQIPSRAAFNPLPPFVNPGTQGRPINLVMIPTDCANDLAELTRLITHEIVEAATDPLPIAHWIDMSSATTGGTFDLGQIGSLFTNGEISDICGTQSARFTASDGTALNVAAYWSNHDNACVSLDVTPPTTTANASPAPASGWANSDVTVALQAVDQPTGSGVAEIAFSATGAQPIAETHVAGATTEVTITAEGITILRYFATDEAGNVETTQTTVVRIDRTAPSIVASAAPPANSAGWNRSDVTISFACSDTLSGVASCSPAVVLSAEGTGQSASGSVTDRAGNANAVTLGGIAIDKTAPVITYAGNTGSYTIDLQVDITCTATDNLSGVEQQTCVDVHQPAWSLALGVHILDAEATDFADNIGFGSTAFDVLVTEASLCNLTRQFSTNPAIADALCTKLDSMHNALTPTAREGARGAYLNQLNAQSGKALTTAQAAVLRNLANAL